MAGANQKLEQKKLRFMVQRRSGGGVDHRREDEVSQHPLEGGGRLRRASLRVSLRQQGGADAGARLPALNEGAENGAGVVGASGSPGRAAFLPHRGTVSPASTSASARTGRCVASDNCFICRRRTSSTTAASSASRTTSISPPRSPLKVLTAPSEAD